MSGIATFSSSCFLLFCILTLAVKCKAQLISRLLADKKKTRFNVGVLADSPTACAGDFLCQPLVYALWPEPAAGGLAGTLSLSRDGGDQYSSTAYALTSQGGSSARAEWRVAAHQHSQSTQTPEALRRPGS